MNVLYVGGHFQLSRKVFADTLIIENINLCRLVLTCHTAWHMSQPFHEGYLQYAQNGTKYIDWK